MNDFVQLWVYLAATPLFGLTATLAVYVGAHALHQRSGLAAWANPVLWSVVAIAAFLLLTGTPYPAYFAGAQFVHVLLGPAVARHLRCRLAHATARAACWCRRWRVVA